MRSHEIKAALKKWCVVQVASGIRSPYENCPQYRGVRSRLQKGTADRWKPITLTAKPAVGALVECQLRGGSVTSSTKEPMIMIRPNNGVAREVITGSGNQRFTSIGIWSPPSFGVGGVYSRGGTRWAKTLRAGPGERVEVPSGWGAIGSQ